MIINCFFRGPGDLATHICRTDTNESVRVSTELSFGCSLDVADAIADFAALGAAYGVVKSLVHISVSPGRPLSGDQEQVMMARLRKQFGIPDDHPVLVVEHFKPGPSGRPTHYHVVFPRAVAKKKQIRSSFSKIIDERISIELEFDFNHPLVPGPNLDAVRRVLANERPDMTAALAELTPAKKTNNSATVSDRALAFDSAADLAAFDSRVLEAWEKGDFEKPDRLSRRRIKLAEGDRALMVVDLDTGLPQSLARVINRESKRRGTPLNLRQRDVAHLHVTDGSIAALPQVRRAVIRESAEKMPRTWRQAHAVERYVCADTHKFDRSPTAPGPQLTTSDGAKPEISPSSKKRSRPNTIAANLEIIRKYHRPIIECRERTAERAWKAASIWRSTDAKTFVAWAAAGVTFACGGGLLISVAAAAFAAQLAVQRGRRKLAEAKDASAELKRSRADLHAEMDEYFAHVRAANAFRLNAIPRQGRLAASYIYRSVAEGDQPRSDVANALEKLSPGLPAALANVARYGTSLGLSRVLEAGLQPDDPKCEQSLSAFVRNASESELSPQTAEPRHVVPNLTESELSGSHEKHLGTNTITADYDSVHHRAAAERRARAAERAWKSARVWRTTDLETFVKLAAAGRPFGSGGGLLLSLAAAAFVGRLAVARGRRKLDKTMGASAEL